MTDYPTDEIRERLTNDYMRGFRAAVVGELYVHDVRSTFGSGYAFGVIAGGQAMIKAGLHASEVLDSPAMAQAKRNAEGTS